MRSFALLVGVFMATVGIVGMIVPSMLPMLARPFLTPLGLYAASALRIAIGIVLVLAASASRSPGILRAVGVVALVAGIMTPFVGLDRARAMVDWWSTHGAAWMRLWAGVALALGAFVTYAVASRRRV